MRHAETPMDQHDRSARAIALYDDFTHNHLDRRRFFAKLTRLAGSAAAANVLAAALAANPAAAALIAPKDPRVRPQWLTIPDAQGHRLKAYFALPSGPAKRRPAVLVIHENRGLNGYIEDVTRRLAVAGFTGLAVDFLSGVGGTPADEDKARELIGGLDPAATTANALAAIHWLRADSRTNGKVGALGFCWGGGIVNRLAVAAGPALIAGTAFYGPTPPAAQAGEVKAAMLLHYAGNDPRVNPASDAWVAALRAAHVQVTRYDYPGTEHAFHNDTASLRYNRQAAERAWQRSIRFFRKELA